MVAQRQSVDEWLDEADMHDADENSISSRVAAFRQTRDAARDHKLKGVAAMTFLLARLLRRRLLAGARRYAPIVAPVEGRHQRCRGERAARRGGGSDPP